MALISQKTDLKSLRYGQDRVGGGSSNQPYIKSKIPDNSSSLDRSGGIDFLLRGGTLAPSRAAKDVSRLTKMFFDFKSPNGVLFTAKQNLLSRTAVKTQASGIINEGAYLPTSTILQAGGNAFGTHLLKQGLNPFRDTAFDAGTSGLFGFQDPLGLPVYTQTVKFDQPITSNRLVQLKFEKLGQPKIPSTSNFFSNAFTGTFPIFPTKENQISLGNNDELLKYDGGPGSILGIGKTIIRRYSNTNSGLTNKYFTGQYYVLDSQTISGKSSSKLTTQISDFRTEIPSEQIVPNGKKNILASAPNYSILGNRIENRVNLGDPGKRDKNVSSYTKGLGAPLDKITAMPLYQSDIANHRGDRNDLVKFSIGIIDNDNPSLRTYIHFRAFLDSMDDNYTAEWENFRYMGRGEKFYRYNGFTRTVNLAWTVAAQSKEELIPMYQKLNFLASSLTPDYSANGYMRGNLAVLTVGGYLFDQPGIIQSMNYTVPTESPWEIGINDSEIINNDSSVKELPHMIKVTGFQFIPIHKFVPKLQKNTYNGVYNKDSEGIDTAISKFGKDNENGEERYIALATGNRPEDNNYDSPGKNSTWGIVEQAKRKSNQSSPVFNTGLTGLNRNNIGGTFRSLPSLSSELSAGSAQRRTNVFGNTNLFNR